MDKDAVVLTFDSIWAAFIDEVGGEPKYKDKIFDKNSSKTSQIASIDTAEFGVISQVKITGPIIYSKFGGEHVKRVNDTNSRGYRFSLAKLEKLKRNYSKFEEIKIDDEYIKTLGGSGRLGRSTEDMTQSEPQKQGESCNNSNVVEEGSQQSSKNVEDSTNKTDVKESEHSQNPPNLPNLPQQSQEQGSLKPFGFVDPIHDNSEGDMDVSQQSQKSQNEEPIIRELPPMPKALADDALDVVTEEDPEYQKSKFSTLAFDPMISIEDFYSNDMPLDTHSFHQSPCYPIIELKQDEMGFEYCCKLHPKVKDTLLSAIELHCRKIEPDMHKAAMLKASLSENENGDMGDTA